MKNLIKQLLIILFFLIYFCLYIGEFLPQEFFLFASIVYLFLIFVIYIAPYFSWRKFPLEGFFLLYALVVIGVGMISAVEKVKLGWWPQYNINLNIPAFYCSVFMTIFVITLLMKKQKKGPKQMIGEKNVFNIDLRTLKIVSLLLFFSGVISTIFILGIRGSAPITNPTLRFKFFEGYTFLNYTLTYALVLAQIFSFLLYKNNFMHILEFGIIFLVSSGILLLTAARGIFLMPIFSMFLIENYVYKKVKISKLIAFSIFVFLTFVFVYAIRENREIPLIERLKYFYRLFPEFFDFALLVQIVPREIPYSYAENVFAGLTIWLPKAFWNLFGVDKDYILVNSPPAKISNFLGRTTGTRLSIFGDAYFSAGTVGIIFWAFLLGVIMNKFLADVYQNNSYSKKVLGVLGCSVLIFIIPFELGVGFLPRVLLYYIYPYIFFRILEKKNAKKD